MKITLSEYQLVVELNDENPALLIVEHPQTLVNITQSLYRQYIGDEGNIIFSDNDKSFSMNKKVILLLNPFLGELNDKRIIKGLYLKIQEIAKESSEEAEIVNQRNLAYIEKLIEKIQYDNIIYDFGFSVESLLKMYSVRIEDNYSNLVEYLSEYFKATKELCDTDAIIILNLHQYATPGELKQLYKMAAYYKLKLLIIDSKEPQVSLGEKTYVIDKDCCNIVK
jgi:CRISPR type II-A-associated protein Csn2